MGGAENYKSFLAGDEAGLVSLVTEYSDNLIYYAYQRVKNFNIAENLTEAAFVKLVLKKPALKSGGEIAEYLYKTVGEAVKAASRKRNAKGFVKGFLGEVRDLSESEWAEKYLIKTPEDRRKYEVLVLCKTDTDVKTILFLCFFQKLDFEQIVRITGRDKAVVEKAIIAGHGALMPPAVSGTKGGEGL